MSLSKWDTEPLHPRFGGHYSTGSELHRMSRVNGDTKIC